MDTLLVHTMLTSVKSSPRLVLSALSLVRCYFHSEIWYIFTPQEGYQPLHTVPKRVDLTSSIVIIHNKHSSGMDIRQNFWMSFIYLHIKIFLSQLIKDNQNATEKQQEFLQIMPTSQYTKCHVSPCGRSVCDK